MKNFLPSLCEHLVKILSNIHDSLVLASKYPRSTINTLIRDLVKPFYIIWYGTRHGREQYYLIKLARFLRCERRKVLVYFEEIDDEFIGYSRSQTKTIRSQTYQEWRDYRTIIYYKSIAAMHRH